MKTRPISIHLPASKRNPLPVSKRKLHKLTRPPRRGFFWTQLWTQTPQNTVIRGRLRCTNSLRKCPKIRTQRYATTPDATPLVVDTDRPVRIVLREGKSRPHHCRYGENGQAHVISAGNRCEQSLACHA